MTALDPECAAHDDRGHNGKVNFGHHVEPQTPTRSFTDNATDKVDGSVVGVKTPAVRPAPFALGL
jgi:hypothetical protein